MTDVVLQKLPQLLSLCKRYGVRRFDLIGSALRDDFNVAQSDIDFVVEFEQLTTANAFDRYFGLLNDLEDLFARPIDLISYPAIRNPHFKAAIDKSRVQLYAA